jgi:hypothetical protein
MRTSVGTARVNCGRRFVTSTRRDQRVRFYTESWIFPQKRLSKALDPKRSTGAVFISPEEQSSRRRERTRSYQREPATELNQEVRQLNAWRWNQESSYDGCSKKMMGNAGFGLREPDRFEIAIVCDLGAEPDLRKFGREGRDLARGFAPFAFVAHLFQDTHRAIFKSTHAAL